MIDIYVIEYADQIVYVGQSRNIDRREKQHRHASKMSTEPVYEWMREHPEWTIRVIDTVEPREARSAERRWINHYLGEGAELKNVIGAVDLSKPVEPGKVMSGADRQRKLRQERQRQLAEKRASAKAKGVQMVESAVLAIKDGNFSAYVWRGTELVEIGNGKLLDTD